MKKTLTALALIALLPAGAALADDDDCNAPRDQWQPREAAMQMAEQNGWTVRDFEIDDGCYEIEGRDQNGFAVQLRSPREDGSRRAVLERWDPEPIWGVSCC